MAGEFVERNIPPRQDCDDHETWGDKSQNYYYIFKGNAKREDYPEEACTPWYHATAKIDSLKLTGLQSPGITGLGDISITGTITSASEVTAAGITLTSRKPFDIPHPTKKGYRLRHVCLEGPESGVYIRGRLTDSSTIEVPDYWDGLVDPETITVQLTQIGCSQDLIVDKIEWGKKIKVKSGNASKIDCYYYIQAERADGEKLIVEYEGQSSDDYPGDNSIYSINK